MPPEGSPSAATSASSDGITLLTRLILANEPIQSILDKIVDAADATIAPVSTASVSLKVEGKFETPSATAGEAIDIDSGQYRDAAGPCVDATDGKWSNVPDISATADRWPSFAAEAAANGVQSSLSVPLTIGSTTLGALNLYSHDLNAFGAAEEHLARQVGEQAAATIANAQALAAATTLNEQLQEAMRTREMIGRATGIIMTRERCTAEEGFDILRRASQNTNRKLRDLAQEVCEAADRVAK